jgi:hypothetical protein
VWGGKWQACHGSANLEGHNFFTILIWDFVVGIWNKGCVSQWGLGAFTLKKYLKAKEEEENYGNSNYISPCKNNIIFKKSSKRDQNPSRYYYYNSIITNLKFQHKLGKISSFKNPHMLTTHAMFFNFGHIWKNLCLMTHCVCVWACVCTHTRAPHPMWCCLHGIFLSSRDNIFSCCQLSSQKQHATPKV